MKAHDASVNPLQANAHDPYVDHPPARPAAHPPYGPIQPAAPSMSNPFDMQSACPSQMRVQRAGEGIAPAPSGVSSGPFLVQMLLSSRTDGEMTAMRIFAPPGVVTHWHSHPRGQLLFVIDGVGYAQRDGGQRVEIRAGDCVWFAPGERHWHGAAPSSPFSYISIQPVLGDSAVDWMEPLNSGDRLP
ncbi:quercetin dioxygenase-like cupin family protein [Rhizobium sp. SG_E_25_P2]|nr:quercetin dioxygenase-like cupin family protein [Rhizobium sp. SG_E_25_P2]